jgi:uncharacterized protein (TIGR03437 family)
MIYELMCNINGRIYPGVAANVNIWYRRITTQDQSGTPDGSATPSSPLSNTTNPVNVTIGGKPGQVYFAGFAPGFAGLYQVNVTVPQGVGAGTPVPVVLTAAGASSVPVTVAIQ